MNDNLEYFKNIDDAIAHFENATDKKLFDFLKSDDEVLQQIALLKLSEISSPYEAELIVETLTEHSSETREYCSFLVNRLMKIEKHREFFKGDLIFNKFFDSVSDVNPKVCRKIIEILPYYINIKTLYKKLLDNSFILINELIEKNKNKNYKYNTKSFHLYWHIFALGYTLNEEFFIENKVDLLKLVEALFDFSEYTLREKAAYLLNNIAKFLPENAKNELLNKYANDENFYVKEIFC